MKEAWETTFLRNVLRNDVEFDLTGQKLGALFVKLLYVWNHVLKRSI